MKRLLTGMLALIAVVMITGAAHAGDVVYTNYTAQSMNVTEVQWSITTNSSVSGTVQGLDGLIERIVFVGGSTTAHTNTITLTDTDSVDVFLSQGAESGTTLNIYADNGDTVLPIAVWGNHTFAVTSTVGVAVSTNGVTRIYWR
jgi:hypothetical protein